MSQCNIFVSFVFYDRTSALSRILVIFRARSNIGGAVISHPPPARPSTTYVFLLHPENLLLLLHPFQKLRPQTTVCIPVCVVLLAYSYPPIPSHVPNPVFYCYTLLRLRPGKRIDAALQPHSSNGWYIRTSKILKLRIWYYSSAPPPPFIVIIEL